MNTKFESLKIVSNDISNAIKTKFDQIQIIKSTTKPSSTIDHFNDRDLLFLTFTDSSLAKVDLEFRKNWWIGDRGSELLDRCFSMMRLGEEAQFAIIDTDNSELIRFSVAINRLEKAPLMTRWDDEYACRLADHYRAEGNEYYRLDRLSEAMSNYEAGLRLVWVYGSARHGAFWAREHGPGTSEHRDEVGDAIERLLLNIAACQLRARAFTAAADSCSVVLRARPRSLKALYRRGKAHRELGRLDEAYEDLRAAFEISPADGDVARDLNEVKERLARYRSDMSNKMKKMFV